MADPLESIRCLVSNPSDAIRWACLLEATAPKAGNVYPGRPFEDLAFVDFVAAAEIAAKRFRRGSRISQRMLQVVQESVKLTSTNVNLGIVLLLGPLVAADERMMDQRVVFRTDETWKNAVGEFLNGLDGLDGQTIFRTIESALAGGLGSVPAMDVNDEYEDVDLIAAMQLVADRDRIARQYVDGFADLIDKVVPTVHDAITERGDVLGGISRAQLLLLRDEPDSLIGRKNGPEVASSVQSRARKVDLGSPESIARFDDSLRSGSHKLNPGTTADLIAGALYVLLRTPIDRETQ